jgi:TonB-linked SusC/RagA family outer membrane protein
MLNLNLIFMKENLTRPLKKREKLASKISFLMRFVLIIACLFSSGMLYAQQTQRSLSGTVVDSEGLPLPGVTVMVKGTSQGTVTDMDGKFTIKNLPESSTIVVSFIGMSSQEIIVGNQTTIDIKMEMDSIGLDDIVVVGFGTQKKVNLTGAVSTVSSEMLESRPVQNVSQALQGVVPGLNFSTAGMGGELNQQMSFNIRGAGTIGSGSTGSPLVLIDGMEGNLNALNPQDIENISVLKDAAAASIYGSRAPFGVILITTKAGKVGKTTVNYNNNFKWTSPLGLPEMMDSHTFALYWNEAAANDGEGAKFSQEVLDRIVKFQKGEIDYGTVPNANGDRWQYYTGSNANTDWFKEQYKNSAFAQEHAVSLNGGNENTRFYVSGNFLDQDGLARHSDDNFNRYALTGKINSTISKYVKFNYNSKFIREDYEEATHQFDLFFHNIARRWPTVPAKDPNGQWSDPSEIAQLEEGGRSIEQTDYLYQQGQLIITPLKGWNIFAEGNYRITNNNYHQEYLPAYAYDVSNNPFPIAVGWNSAGYTSVYEYNRKDNFFTSNIYSDYEFTLNDAHYFKILGGFNSELMKYRTVSAQNINLITPTLPTINTAAGSATYKPSVSGQYQHWATAGFFSRLNYNYKERYLLEVNARYDGTSRFLEDKRWNLFPSFSAGWNIAKEGFWQWTDLVNVLKFRGSYGELGNQNTSNWYPFFSTMPVGIGNGSWLINNAKPNTSSAPGIVSSLLTWEQVKSWNIGFDLAMFENKLNVNFDYFNRMTEDMVGPAPELPVILGTSVPQINNADMKSYGFEIEATWQDNIGKVNYSIRGVLTDDQQEVTNYPNPTGNIGTWYNGRKAGEIWGYTTIGIAKTQAEMDSHLATISQSNFSSKWGAGDIMYADMNNDKKIDGGAGVLGDTGDRTIIGNSTPRFRFSTDFAVDYKGIDLRIFIQGVGKRDWMPNGPYFWGASGGMWQSAGFTTHMDYFRDENSIMVKEGKAEVNLDSYFPKPYFNTGKNQQTQTRFLQSAAYARLKNLQLGYTIPSEFSSKIGISKARFYISGENLLTMTKMTKTFDPETVALSGWNDGKTYPLAKVFSCGVSVNF